MSVNHYRPHVLVLPEDDANSQLANGFHLELDFSNQNRLQVLEVAGGWLRVIESFTSKQAADMGRWQQRLMVLLIDFDCDVQQRLELAKRAIPDGLADRVFILGASVEPESLKKQGLGTYENIGKLLARDCREGTNTMWGHPHLAHNAGELHRMRERVNPILFQP